ncbi:MAG: serine O-acetyltransferase EpsC [Candidatus Bruticola sp.]
MTLSRKDILIPLQKTARKLMKRSCSEAQNSSYAGIKEQLLEFIRYVRAALYPEVFEVCSECGGLAISHTEFCVQRAFYELNQALGRIMDSNKAESVALEMIKVLPQIRDMLDTDIQAAYDGDPAARSLHEIMLAYPSFEAISIYRLAHSLYELNVPILPRIMTEYAHQTTGIDIHPGAKIDKYFFIDHGTGVVIGETTVIGHHVKLYQGVTLGAKSFECGADGNPVKGINRHPHIGNYVVIYAGATILGGETYIGDHCVIGGNVWLTHSVDNGETVIAAHGRANHHQHI